MHRPCPSADAPQTAPLAGPPAASPFSGTTRDAPNGYGWISIILHWVAAGIVVALWYLGSLSQVAADPARYLELTASHMTLAIMAYPLLWLRVIWRLRAGHPGPGPTQTGPLHRMGRYLHYGLILAIAAMLLSGPLMVWSGGGALRIFDVSIPSPLPRMPGLHDFLRAVHGVFGTLILAGIVLHVGAVILHVAIMRDGSFDRIMVPDRRPDDREPSDACVDDAHEDRVGSNARKS